jgi:hypothetical protein
MKNNICFLIFLSIGILKHSGSPVYAKPRCDENTGNCIVESNSLNRSGTSPVSRNDTDPVRRHIHISSPYLGDDCNYRHLDLIDVVLP